MFVPPVELKLPTNRLLYPIIGRCEGLDPVVRPDLPARLPGAETKILLVDRVGEPASRLRPSANLILRVLTV
jgi:hypothetical protein